MTGSTSRRSFLGLAAGALALSGCAIGQQSGTGATLALDAPLPDQVPDDTKIIIGDPSTQKALQLSGELDELPFIEWANLSGGPQTTEAFRAGALDAGSVAEIPPIHARWTGLEVKIIASRFRVDPLHHPVYEFGVAPGTAAATLEEFRGKKIAFSPGQAQGALVLKALRKAGLTKADVQLIELPSTGDVYANALAARQVDIAPIGGVQIKRYLGKYAAEGAATIQHGLRDDPGHVYALESSLADPGKAAALRQFVAAWARAVRWVDEHPDQWIEGYYVADQGLSAADGRWLVERTGKLEIPDDLTDVYVRHQETIDLLAAETGNDPIKAEDLYDPRFVPVATEAFAAEGRS
ncbi:ABC transporter substrate-binding protein [Microlunatus speluncae]|uniref:ABC transporter substrate-binding protein n=1 Tax=Microlunatus speluncae TaxID=2594267 RepID=UPI001266328D|nr:ABC transporter substrate-binding protein [Microlunatus speluncae]